MPNYRLATRRAAEKYGVDPAILEALIQQESGFNPHAKSGAGAQGIAQFMPGTAPGYGVNLHDNRVTDDLEGAAKYIAANLRKTGGNYAQALSIYNSGKPNAYKDPHFAGGQTYNYVKTILGNAKRSGGDTASASYKPPAARTTTKTVGAVDNSQARKQLALSFLLGGAGPNGQQNTSDPVALALGAQQLKDNPGRTVTTTVPGAAGASSDVAKVTSRANAIDAKQLPYLWGGGHAGKVNAYQAKPLDCSGAVSAVLGIDPRVASQFKGFGKPGDGGNRGVTIYAKDTHVLMKINGHFFGTSTTNPGGGAGWIKQQDISPAYLQGFTARHV